MTPLLPDGSQHGSAITMRQLTKTFNGVAVLQPTDLQISAGEILVLLGPSGCGKTTLLRLIAGLEQPDRAEQCIYFDGEDVGSVPVERRNVGMVFQSYALFPNMSVAENVAYGLKMRKVSAHERQAETERLLLMVGLEDFGERRIAALSGGQRQRVALARALAIKPRVLLLDEPLAALDAVLRERLRVEIGLLLRKFGITAVYVTHDQAEAMAIGDRIAVMQGGRIAQIGSPQTIYHQPVNDFVADFVGTMNRLPGRIVKGEFVINGAGTGARLAIAGPDRDTTLCFRPEAVRLATGHAAITARVTTSTFFGATQRLVAEVAPQHSLQLDLPSTLSFQAGDIVAFDIDPQAIIEFPRET